MNKLYLGLCLSLVLLINQTFALSNPASDKCIADGGKINIIKDSSGAESGICTFANNKTCEEWAYFRGECTMSDSVSIGTIIPVIVGNDKHSHGCIGSAGYSWSTGLKQCIRPWELYDLSIDQTPATNHTGINRIIQNFVQQQTNLFLSEAGNLGTGLSFKPELNITWTTLNNKDNILSIKANVYSFLGGAHGSTTIHTFTFNTKTGKLMSLGNIIRNKKSVLKTIASRTYATFYKDLKEYTDTKRLQEGTSTSGDNYNNFTVTTTKGKISTITFYFAQYQVAAYVAGTPTITFALPSLTVIK